MVKCATRVMYIFVIADKSINQTKSKSADNFLPNVRRKYQTIYRKELNKGGGL